MFISAVAAMKDAEAFYGTPIDGHPLARVNITTRGPKPLIQLRTQWYSGLSFDDLTPVDDGVREMGTLVDRVVQTFQAAACAV